LLRDSISREIRPRVSVVIAAKNSEKTVLLAVRSALNGLRRYDEVLVMNDNSSDQTGLVLRGIRDRRLRIFESSVTLGRSEARNRLISESKGELIAILDADDFSLPWRFELGRRALNHYDAVFSTALVFGSALKLLPFLPQIPRAIHSNLFAQELLGRNPVVHSTAIYRKSAIPSSPPYRDSEAEEYDLWLRMINAGCLMRRYRFPWVLYRLHEGQASRAPGFNKRGEECPFVIGEQEKLASHLQLTGLSLDEAKAQARSQTSSRSLLARIEIRGLPERVKRLLRIS